MSGKPEGSQTPKAEDEWWETASSSDEDEIESGGESKKTVKNKKKSYFKYQEQDALFAENEDEVDEKWVKKQWKKQGLQEGETSDAFLSCPCCFTMVCMNCQRHEQYPGQYRAMFVTNCTEDEDGEKEGGEKCVKCENCDYQIGVVNAEGVYTLYEVLPSDC